MTGVKNEGHKDCPWEYTEKQCCVGGTKQEFSYGHNVEKWPGVEICRESGGEIVAIAV